MDLRAKGNSRPYILAQVEPLTNIILNESIRVSRDGITESMGMSLSKPREFVMDRETRRAAIHGVAKSRT